MNIDKLLDCLTSVFCNSAWILQTLEGDRDDCIEVIFDCDVYESYQIRVETPYFDKGILSKYGVSTLI